MGKGKVSQIGIARKYRDAYKTAMQKLLIGCTKLVHLTI